MAAKPKSITFTNTGKVRLTISSIATAGGNATGDFDETSDCPISPNTLRAGGNCAISVTFLPSALGSCTATLTVTSNSSLSPQSVSLSGSGTAPLTASTTSLSLGSVVVGTAGAAKLVTLTNGFVDAPLAIYSVTTSANFAVASNSCGASISAAGKCTIGVSIEPTSLGKLSGTLTINYGAVESPASIALSGTGVDNDLASISVTPVNSSVPAGDALQFAATGNFKNGSTENLTSFVAWSSSKTSVATIAAGGGATGVTAGTTSISATLGTFTGSTTLTVTPATLVSIAVTPANPSIAKGATQQFTAIGTYSNATTQSITDSVTWASSNPPVATVSGGGLATGIAAGTSAITATLGGVTSPAITLTVAPPTLVSIAVTPTIASVAVGGTQQFTATGTYSNGTTQNITNGVTWASSNPLVVPISVGGLATGAATGTSSIAATLDGVTSPAATLTVAARTLVSIAVTPANPSLADGTNMVLTATGLFSDGSTQDLTTFVSWSSSQPAVTVSNASGNQGVVTGASVGSATVTATSTTTPLVSGSTTVTVTAAVLQSITINPASPSLAAGLQLQFTAVGMYNNGLTQDITGSVTWSSSNQGIATISNAMGGPGEATASSQGTTTITATLGSINSSTTLTVGPAALVSISVNPPNPSIALGTPQQFSALGSYSDGSTQDITNSVTWSAAPAGVATISNTPGSFGMATTVGQGITSITATSNSTSGSTQLTVTGAVLTSIALSPASISIYQGATQQFIATGTFSDGTTQNVTASVTWSADDGTIATVSNSSPQGLVTGVAGGQVQVVATYTPTSGPAITSVNTGGGGNLTVIALNSVTLQTANTTVALGSGALVQFTATATFADGSTSNVTASATWTSSNPGVAAISNTQGAQGQASPVSVGTTNITASYSSMAGSTALTVLPSATLNYIAVSPNGTTLGLFGTQQFTATGYFNDGTTLDLTQIATWSSFNPEVVTVNSTGLATVVSTPTPNVAVAVSASFGTFGPWQGSNTAWVSTNSSLPPYCPSPTIDMKLLVINNAAASYADFAAIQQILNYVGTPYDVVDVITGTLPPLSDGACHAYYQGVIYAFGDDIYNNSAFYQALTQFEQTFKIRQLNWFTYPTPDFGFNYASGYIASTGTDSGSFTSAAVPVFYYANTNTPLAVSNAYIYLTTPDAPSGGTVTPLLVDGSGNVLSGVTQFSDGRQYLTHDLVLAYGLINWVAQGVFLGDYHVYANAQVDDVFIDDSEWIPGTSCEDPITRDRTPPDASNLPVFRVNSADMTQLVAWQSGIQNDPSGLLSNFELTLAFNGVGTAGNGDWTGLTAPITATSSVNNLATFTTTDFSGLPGAQVTVAGTSNEGGIFNGTWTILSVASSSSTTPATTTFTATVPGSGTATQQPETGATAAIVDDLVGNLQSYQGAFHWISHTYDHPTTLNGLCKSTPTGTGCGDVYDNPPTDDIDLEVLTNLWVASSPNGQNLDNDPSDTGLAQLTFNDFNPANMVTPGITGLNDPNVPGYLYADGIQYVVTDTSVIGQPNNGPNPSPNVGIVNSYEPNIYEVPRHPNDIYYNVANWNDDQAEFDCIYSYPTVMPPYNSYTAAQILNFVSASFVTNMLIGDMDPEMFHQPDLHFSVNTAPGMTSTGQTISLLADTYNQTFSQYKQLYNLPVLSLTLDQIGQAMQNRNAFNQSNVTASIVGAYGSGAAISVTVPSSSSVPSAVIPVTGLNSAGAEVYGGQYISYISIAAGQTVTLPLP